jgi:hypothetical protein
MTIDPVARLEGQERAYAGAADKAMNLVGCKSPHHQLPVFGWLAISDACGGNEACSARVKASAARWRQATAVGTIGEASKLGDRNIKEWLQSRKTSPSGNRFDGKLREADLLRTWGRPMTWRKKQANALQGTAVTRGPGIQGRIHRDNVGKVLVAAGADGNLRRLLKRG